MSFELLDDQLALHDALAFIDAYGQSTCGFDQYLSPSTEPELPLSSVGLSTAQEIATPAPKVKKPRQSVKRPAAGAKKRNHGDPKAEIEQLRLETKLLESKLAQLHECALLSNGPLSSATSSEDGSMDEGYYRDQSMLSMWKAVALRQFQRRRCSEDTRRKLERALDKQLKVARALEQLIVKHAAHSEMGLLYDLPSFDFETSPLSRDDSISALLSNHVRRLRVDMDIHLFSSDLMGPECRIVRTLSKTDLCRGVIQETTSKTTLPLRLRKADDVLWGGMKKYHRQDPGAPPHNFAYVEDGVDKSFMSMIDGVGYSYNLATRTVMRKFVTEERIIYAWSSIATVKNKNVRFRGEGLVVLERSAPSPLDSTLLMNWHRLYAEDIDPRLVPTVSASEIDKLKVTVLNALSQGSAEYFDSLENALLEAAAMKKSAALSIELCVPRV